MQSLNAVADQDTFYDVTDVLEEQGMEEVIKLHTDRKNGDIDLLEQFQIYEAVLRFEDGVGEESEQPAFDSLRSDTDRTEFLTESLTFHPLLGDIHVYTCVCCCWYFVERLSANKARTNRGRVDVTPPTPTQLRSIDER